MSRFQDKNTFLQRLKRLNWVYVALITALTALGIMALYSAAGGQFDPWAKSQLIRFVPCFILMLIIACIDVRWIFTLSPWIWLGGLLLLLAVQFLGHIGMGAQRWIDLGFMRLQPSELMKIAVILMLARLYQTMPFDRVNTVTGLGISFALILIPAALIFLQPDLGTTLMLVIAGLCVVFMAGLSWWLVSGGALFLAVSIPLAWQFLLHDYQKERVLTFLEPERDPLGAGYHITQSKIAIGSGGLSGKGFLNGSQSRLDFLPEKQTDFIFTLWVEEWGLFGGLTLIGLIGAILTFGFIAAMRCRHVFGRLLALGLTMNFAIYTFINIGMVMGLLPVVGAPLPLVSYGGTAMLSALISFGLILNVEVNRNATMPKPGGVW